jgi:hypothetical protein
VICVCCGADLSAGGSVQPETQHLLQQDMPRWGSPVSQQQGQQPYAQQYPQQPYAQQYPQQPYAQQYPQQPYAQQYPQQPYAQQYPQPAAQQSAPMQRQYSEEERRAAQKKRTGWRIMNLLLYLVQIVLITGGVYMDDVGKEIGAFMICGWLLSTLFFAIASAAARPDDAYLEKPPAIRSRFLQGLIQFLIGCTSFITGAVLWAIISEIF